MANKKEEYHEIRKKFRNMIKNYFPNYSEWDKMSVMPVFTDLAAYINDTMSYYQDTILNELLVENATNKDILRQIARSRGYKFKGERPAIGKLTISVDLDETPSGSAYLPKVKQGSTLVSDIGGITFTLLGDCDFTEGYKKAEKLSDGNYRVYKDVQVIGAGKTTTTHEVTETTEYYEIALEGNNKIITEVVDTSSNKEWREVTHLSQDLIIDPIENENGYDEILLISDDKKFVVEKDSVNTKIIFGAGNYTSDALKKKEFILSPPYGRDLNDSDLTYNLSDMLNETNYGRVPEQGTTFRITYYETDGELTNIPPSNFSTFGTMNVSFPNGGGTKESTVKNSMMGRSESGFTTGASEETTNELKSAIKLQSNAQQRMVTAKDFEMVTLKLPAVYGNIYKVNAIKSTDVEETLTKKIDLTNVIPSIDLYVLGKNTDDKLATINDTVKSNLQKWLTLYRMATDGVNIKDGYIINIGIKATVVVASFAVPSQVELEIIDYIEDYLSIENRNMGENINKSKLINKLFTNIKGLKDIKELAIYNLTAEDGNYSNYEYDIGASTKGNVIGCPSYGLFEIKFPDTDIKIRSVRA